MYTISNEIYAYKVNNITLSGSLIKLTFDEPFVTNRQYTTTVSAGLTGVYDSETYYLLNDFAFWFTSRYCPIFSTVGKIKLTGGPSIENFYDDTIFRMMHKNSLDVVDLLNQAHNTNYAYDYWGCSWHDVPLVMRRYVECKTAYDLISLLKLSSSMNGGPDQIKTLGDLTIKYGGSNGNSGANADPNKLRELYNCWNEAMRSLETVRIAVKGYFDTSKGYGHPVREFHHNRIIRGVSFNNSNPNGPWYNSPEWIGYYHGQYPSGPGRY